MLSNDPLLNYQKKIEFKRRVGGVIREGGFFKSKHKEYVFPNGVKAYIRIYLSGVMNNQMAIYEQLSKDCHTLEEKYYHFENLPHKTYELLTGFYETKLKESKENVKSGDCVKCGGLVDKVFGGQNDN